MYASLYELFNDWFGIKFEPLKIFHTFGVCMALAFLAAAIALIKELKRKEDEGLLKPIPAETWVGKGANSTELLETFVFVFAIFFKLIYIAFNFSEFKADAEGVVLSLKGNALGGLIVAILYTYYVYREKEKKKLPEPKLETTVIHPFQLVGNITLIAAAGGIAGARLFDFFENPTPYLQDPASFFSGRGLTIYGGLIVGAISVLLYTRKKGIPILHMVDAAAPSMILAYAVGRIGCQMAGDGDWGIPNPNPKPGILHFLPDWMWSFGYPHNVNGEGIPIPGCTGDYCTVLSPGVYPTPFYETIMGLIIFLILWRMRKKIHIPGVLFCWYLVFNGMERFLIELIRVNIKYHFLGISATQAQLISPLFFLTGVIGIIYFTNKAKHAEGKA